VRDHEFDCDESKKGGARGRGMSLASQVRELGQGTSGSTRKKAWAREEQKRDRVAGASWKKLFYQRAGHELT